MRKAKSKRLYLKIIALALAIVFFITLGFLALELWERNQGRFPEQEVAQSEVTYQGKEYVLKDNVETFLALGLDQFEDNNDWSNGKQADFLMLFVFDNDTKQSTAIQINRDTMTAVNRLDIGGNKIDSQVMQIALAYNYIYDDSGKLSCRNTADSVSQLLRGIPVNHYLSFTMNAVPAINDLVGGVEVNVLDDFTGIDDALIKGQNTTLKGEQALTYVRARKGLEDSTNLHRMERQQQYLQNLYTKTLSCMEQDEEFTLRLVDSMDDHMVYDSTDYRMKELINKFATYQFQGIKEIQGESKAGDQFMEFYADESSIEQLVMDVFYEVKNS